MQNMRTCCRVWVLVGTVAVSLSSAACGEVIKADYCVGVSSDESGAIGPDDNAFIVETLDEALLALGFSKFDSPAIVEYKKDSGKTSIVIVRRNLGPAGTVISHFPSSVSEVSIDSRTAVNTAVDNKIRPRYLVRQCENISPGLTPKI